MAPHPRDSRRASGRRGTAAVEFALLAPFLLLLLVGTMEMGRAFWINGTLQFAADETGRHVMVNPAASDAEIEGVALDRLPGVDPGLVTVQILRDTVDGVDFVTVQMRYEFRFVASMLPAGPLTLEGTARTPLLQ